MFRLSRMLLILMIALGSVASFGVASAQESDDLRFIIVSHGQASDSFWSVVQKGAEQAEADMGVTVEYQAPTTYDMVEMSQLIDAAVASNPDGIVVSIPDGDALTPGSGICHVTRLVGGFTVDTLGGCPPLTEA